MSIFIKNPKMSPQTMTKKNIAHNLIEIKIHVNPDDSISRKRLGHVKMFVNERMESK